MDFEKARRAGIVLGCLAIAACGGSSGSDPDDGGPDLPSASIDAPSVQEGDSGTVAATFTITLSEAAPDAVSIRYETAGGDAVAGEDYTAASGTLNLAAGATSATITVQVLGDTLDEPDETFDLELSDATGVSLASASAQATILDDDGAPVLNSQPVTVTEGDADDVIVSLDLVLDAPSGRPISVSYSTSLVVNGCAWRRPTTPARTPWSAGSTSAPIRRPTSGSRPCRTTKRAITCRACSRSPRSTNGNSSARRGS